MLPLRTVTFPFCLPGIFKSHFLPVIFCLLWYNLLTGFEVPSAKERRKLMIELTKDADKLSCCIYKQFLEKRKSGISKFESKKFEETFYKNDKHIGNWHDSDVTETLIELSKAKYIKLFISGSFIIEDSMIIYMENRFKNGLLEVLDILSKVT
jgi:hypothetical protein